MSMTRLKLNTALAIASLGLVSGGREIPMLETLAPVKPIKPPYKAPKPHQGAKEIARRKKRMECK